MHPTTPSDVIPMLAAAPRLPSCSPLELAAALRRLHRAGIRRGYMLLAPTRSGSEPSGDAAVERASGGDSAGIRWWSRLCDLIHTETGLGVVLLDAGRAGLDTHRVREEAGRGGRIAILHDLSRGERSALLEISRGVCTGDRGLLAESRIRGLANFEPLGADAALREGRLAEMLGTSPIRSGRGAYGDLFSSQS